ncbi:MAG: outer membrane protein assembly factor BamB family protein, partial [Acidimicrobiales bacterium]
TSAGASSTAGGPRTTGAGGTSRPWSTHLDGAAIYGHPVAADGRVFVATEADDVYALDAHDGRVLWHANIGTPLTQVTRWAGCGDIDPLGITSTPVVDTATSTLYVVGEISNGADPPSVHRQLVGFNLYSGQIVRSTDADPTGGGDRPVNLLQRAGLALGQGVVYVAYGGLYGDCGFYHGWVVAVSESPGVPNREFDVTPGGSGGAVWQSGAAPVLGPAGNLYVATGNPNAQGSAGYYESVVKLSPDLSRVEASFRDVHATGDEDLGTGSPTLLANGTLFAVGKTDIGYVLRRSDLALVAQTPGVCGSDPDGADVFDAATDAVYVPCRAGGIQEVNLATHTLGWRAGAVNGPPILVGTSLWALGYPGGTLQALDPATGAVKHSLEVGRVATFATPSLADGLLVVATAAGGVTTFTQPPG